MPLRTLSLLLLLSVALAMGSATSSQAGDEAKKTVIEVKSAWAGHGVGSLVHRKTSPMGKMVTEDKRTLVKITDTDYELKVESKTMLGWSKSIVHEPKVTKVEVGTSKSEEVGEETLTIEGKAYPCKKRKSKDVGALIPGGMKPPGGRPGAPGGAPGGAMTGAGTVWLHEKLGMLKSEMTMSVMGREMKITTTVTRLKVATKVGDVTIDCRETTMTNSMMPDGKTVRLSNPDVPGETVRSKMSMSMGGAEMSMVEELVAWVKKPLTPVTTK